MTTIGSNIGISAASAADGARPSDATLYDRMLANLLGSWTRIAQGTKGAWIERVPGAVVAVFPSGPERFFYNNAVLARDLDGPRAGQAAGAIVRAYGDAGVDRYAIWVHESEKAVIAEMTRRGFRVDTSTRAMAMSLNDIAVPCPEVELGPPDWRPRMSRSAPRRGHDDCASAASPRLRSAPTRGPGFAPGRDSRRSRERRAPKASAATFPTRSNPGSPTGRSRWAGPREPGRRCPIGSRTGRPRATTKTGRPADPPARGARRPFG